MRELWTKDEAEFHGEFVNFDVWSWPKPVQNPLPLYIGGNTVNSMQHVLEAGDGWFQQVTSGTGRGELLDQVAEFHERCTTAGRGRLPVTVYAPEPTAAAIEDLGAGGVDRVVLTVSQESRDGALADLDNHARFLQTA